MTTRRFIISAHVVERATARPTCEALAKAMRRFGCPEQILTDNGKVFTGRFGPGTGEVLFDRICRENGIKHLLTKPRSPTTTGKIERWHKTLRREFLNGKTFVDIADAQAQLDAWIELYNHDRPHQSLGMMAPWERFRLAETSPVTPLVTGTVEDPEAAMPPSASRKVSKTGTISFASMRYKAGVWLAGETVDVVCDGGLVHLHHRGVVIATHARRHDLKKQSKGLRRRKRAGTGPRPTPSASAVSVTRKVDSSGNVCFAGASYRAGWLSSVARSKSRSLVTSSRSRSAPNSSAHMRSNTTGLASTARSPTQAVGHAGSTPRNPRRSVR